MTRPICGDCGECRLKTSRLLGPSPTSSLLPGPRPTASALERHARRFGPGQVAETASQYGLSITVEPVPKARSGGGPSLKTRVAGHVRDGYSVEVIAELENLTPGKARRMVEEAT